MSLLIRILTASALLALLSTNIFAGEKTAPQPGVAVMIEPAFTVNPARTALLIMDYQNDIVAMMPEKERAQLVETAAAMIKEARKAKVQVIYVAVRFREGYPEINPQNKMFSSLKQSGRLTEGTPGAEIDGRISPQPGDIVITKRRVGAFSTTELDTILRAKNINKLVLAGISTSGVVLSTVRWASDMDYSLAVVADACADFDPEVHRVLMEKVFPRQATVIGSKEFVKTVGAGKAE